MSEARAGAVVLAAGAASRLGRPKQLLELSGEPLVRRAARTAAEAGYAPVVVVVGAAEDQVRVALSGVPFVVATNPAFGTGAASSVRCGLETLLTLRPEVDGVLLTTCDQPLVEARHLAALSAAMEDGLHPIAASSYGETVGVPALFSRVVFDELRALEGEHGAKRVIVQDPARVVSIALPEGARDVDTEADWSALRGES